MEQNQAPVTDERVENSLFFINTFSLGAIAGQYLTDNLKLFKIMKTKTHNIVRGVFIQNDQILVCQSLNKQNSFLIGGHIEIGEQATSALKREVYEEIGKTINIIRFIGVIEHKWYENEQVNYENNFIFEIEIDFCFPNRNPISKESHIHFFWAPLFQLDQISLEPFPLRKILSKNKIDCFWESTF